MEIDGKFIVCYCLRVSLILLSLGFIYGYYISVRVNVRKFYIGWI